MYWPRWAKSNAKDLARYVRPDVAQRERLAVERDSTLARPGGYLELAEAIYDHLATRDMRYARALYDPQKQVQRIRDPADMLDGSGDGTCLDLAVLYAGMCIGNELLPLIAVFRDHALVLVATDDGRRDAGRPTRQHEDGPWTTEGLLSDGDVVRHLIASGAYLPVECTGFAKSVDAIPATFPEGQGRNGGRLTFAAAVNAGRAQFGFEPREFAFAVDPAVLLDVAMNEPYVPPSVSLANLRTDLRVRLRTVFDDHRLFGGRDDELAWLDAAATAGDDYAFVTGRSGTGKTALLANWVERFQGTADAAVAYHFLSRRHGLARREDMLRTLVQQLAQLAGRSGTLPGSSEELHALYIELLTDADYGRPVVVVLDGLDEAEGWRADASLFPRPLAPQVTVVFSAREVAGTNWLEALGFDPGDATELLLAELGVPAVADLLRAAGGQAVDRAGDANFVELLHERSKGDPLYLHFVVPEIRDGAIESVAELQAQPDGLANYFARWWQEVSQSLNHTSVQDLLGYLLVSRGGLTRDDLMSISDADALNAFTVDAAVDRVARYVTGDKDTGFSLCHPRFQDYLADGPLHSVKAEFRTRLVAWCRRWSEHRSRYALLYYAIHLAEVLVDAEASDDTAKTLVELVSGPVYQDVFMEEVKDFPWLQRQASIALERVSLRDDETAVLRTIQAAMAAHELRARWLRPETVFAAAAQAHVGEARAALSLFPIDAQWREAALVLIAWLAGRAQPDAGRALLDELSRQAWGCPSCGTAVAPDAPTCPACGHDLLQTGRGRLPVLVGRVHAALGLGGAPELTFPYPPHRLEHVDTDEYWARMIVNRLAGSDPEGMDPELRGAMYSGAMQIADPDAGSRRIAEADAPYLVRFALDQPVPGLELLEQYIELHATNPYREYRNVSLWTILKAVVCMPSDNLALRLARGILEKALTSGTVEFREALRLTLLGQRSRAGDGEAAGQRLRERTDQAVQSVGELVSSRAGSDSWGHHARRLGALAEVHTRALDDAGQARRLLDIAVDLPRGFAGFQAMVSASLANSTLVCDPTGSQRSREQLDAGLRSAHNVQDPTFCAWTTARVHGLMRAWEEPVDDCVGLVERFRADPDRPPFCSLWVQGDQFAFRDPQAEVFVIPDAMRAARNLNELARDVFNIPLADLVRLNPGVPTTTPRASVNVPDPAVAPKMAAYLSARVLAMPALTAWDQTRLVQRMVPAAVTDATVLDTLLARLLLTLEHPSNELLDGVDRLAPTEWMEDHGWHGALER